MRQAKCQVYPRSDGDSSRSEGLGCTGDARCIARKPANALANNPIRLAGILRESSNHNPKSQAENPVSIETIPTQGLGVLLGKNKAMAIGTNNDTKTITSESSSNSMIDSPE
jgi:hypothetical protein